MDVPFQIKVKLPFNVWDYVPLPNVASNTDQYELIVKFQLPSFFAKLFGTPTLLESQEQQLDFAPSYDRYDQPEPILVTEARNMIEGGSFTLCDEGVGGTYFVRDNNGTNIAVFKPSDEEPGADNNPKKIVKNPILPPGGGSIREQAAYELDHEHFAGVPETFLMSKVRADGFASENEKCGSLQRFVSNEGESSAYGSSSWNVDDIHRIGILDIRIFNMDRNGENMLVQKQENGSYHLVPIDHTYCLPPVSSLSSCYFEWQYWPQAKKPFSAETLAYIENLDVDCDDILLRSLGIEEESIQTMVVTTSLLKAAAQAGWTLQDIACLLSRSFPLSNPSRFEDFLSSCRTAADELGLPFMEVYQQRLLEFVQQRN